MSTAEAIADAFDLIGIPEIEPRYNIAPTQPVLTVAIDRESGRKAADFSQWGLVPHWAKDTSIGSRMINARAETLADKPSFRGPLKYHRCLIVADGFYEWQRQGTKKQPMFVRMANQQPFAFAGLWDVCSPPDGSSLRTCTIITTEPNSLLSPIHNRMPAILHPDDYDAWLDPTVQDGTAVMPYLRPFPAEQMETYPISTFVNSPTHEGPTCIERQ